MKKRRLIPIILFCCVLLGACKSSAVESVERQIDSIGEISTESFSDIQTAFDAYEDLSDKEKASVSNYEALKTAKDAYDQLVAEKVDQLIAQIGIINVNSDMDISAARDAYEALTATQKEYVTQYGILIKAEKEYPPFLLQQTIETINALADPELLEKDNYSVAEQLYNKLSDEQKKQVSKAFNGDLDPILSARITLVSRCIENIAYKKGVPSIDELSQMMTAAEVYLSLPAGSQADVKNIDILKKALKEFTKYVDGREKTDKLYARAVFLNSCEAIDYDDLMTYPKSYKSRAVSIEIKIDELATGIFRGQIKAHVPETNLQLLIKDNREIKEPAFKVGDALTIYGIFDGTKTISVTKDGSGWFGTNVFGKVVDKYDVPIIVVSYASNDNPGVIANGDPSAKDLSLDPEREELIETLKTATKQIMSA